MTKPSIAKAICTFAVGATLLATAAAARAGNGTVGGIKAERPPSTNKATLSPVVRDHRGGSSQTAGSHASGWGNGTVRDHRRPTVEVHFP
jgi:hypothetical protein